MLAISFARTADGLPIVPVNNTILMGWLCMTILVMTATILQPLPLRQSSRGEGYMAIGALAGMAVGLLGYSFASLPFHALRNHDRGDRRRHFPQILLYSRTSEATSQLESASGQLLKYLSPKDSDGHHPNDKSEWCSSYLTATESVSRRIKPRAR